MMRWTMQKLAHYFGTARITVKFDGITEDGFQRATNSEAMRRLKILEGIVYNEYETDSEKIKSIKRDVLEEE